MRRILFCLPFYVAGLSLLVSCGDLEKIWNPDSTPRLLEVPKIVPEEKTEDNLADASLFSLPKLDLLFVIDESGSMRPHQENLSANIARMLLMLEDFAFLDYHIGVITSTLEGQGFASSPHPHSGRLVGYPHFVDRSVPAPAAYLAHVMSLGVRGSGKEVFFDNIYKAFSEHRDGYNSGFYREDAFLAIVILTDTEDQSVEMLPDMLHEFLLEMKDGDPGKLIAYGALIPTGFQPPKTCPREFEFPSPQKIESFIQLMGGEIYNICDSDFGYNLTDMADSILRRFDRWVQLEYPPIPETIRVYYGDIPIPSGGRDGWSYDPKRNALVFGDQFELPKNAPEGSVFSVKYDQAYVKP